MKFCSLFALALLAGSAHAARIVGTIDFSATLSSPSASVSFMAGTEGTVSSGPGSATGSPTYTLLGGSVTNFPSVIGAAVNLDVTAEPGVSVSGVSIESTSGVVRVTNTGSASNFTLTQSLLYSLATFGPTNASLSMLAYIERFNTGTQSWDVIGSTSFGLGTDQSNSACSPACTGGTSTYAIAADAFADIRLRARLTGSASQEASSTSIPEPGGWTLLTAGVAALVLLRRRA